MPERSNGNASSIGATRPGRFKDLARRTRVRTGLSRIALYERLGQRSAGRLTAPWRRHEARSAAAAIQPLEKWERISASSFSTYTEDPNAIRINRLVELIRPGKRILDIGIGFGYVTGILLREVAPAYYCGIDLKPLYLDATRSMLEANELSDRPCHLEVRSVFDIDEEFGTAHDPDLVLVLEVLEHVDDPAGALAAIRDAVRPGTEIIFTVPLLGRLDGVWGHLSVFSRNRLERICAEVGLTIEHAEPLANTWSLIRARTRSGAPDCGTAETDADAGNGFDPDHTFNPIRISPDPERHRRSDDGLEVTLESTKAYLRCEVPRGVDPTRGGVRFPMQSPRVARIDLQFDPPDRVQRLVIRGIDDEGNAHVQWQYANALGRPFGERRTYVLAPGEPSRGMEAEITGEPEDVRWMEVVVEPAPDEAVSLTVYRAAYLGSS